MQNLKEVRQTIKLAKLRLKEVYNIGSLPDFYIIGAAKSGTSSLYTSLTQHPGIINRVEKEIHFFDYPQKRNQGIAYYKANFLSQNQKKYISKKLGYNVIEGDATPFMSHLWIPKWLFEINPNAKLIAILRNPIDRAFSGYHHNKRCGREPLSFEEAIASEPDRIKEEFEKIKTDPQASSYNYSSFSYLGRGHYYEQLIRWLKFFPQDKLCVINFENFVSDPAKICSQLFNFLNLPDYPVKHSNKINLGSHNQQMDHALRAQLRNHFKEHNKKLFQLINKEFDWD
jgi:hypothetical protein